MRDTDKELYYVKQINDDSKSVIIKGLMFGNEIKIEKNNEFCKFAKTQIEISSEIKERVYFTVDFDDDNKPINYGK